MNRLRPGRRIGSGRGHDGESARVAATMAFTMRTMGMRIAMLASECEPWAKTGGLADVVDALARALGRLSVEDIEGPVDVFLPRYRGVPGLPNDASGAEATIVCVPDPRAPAGVSDITITSAEVNGYRLRLIDHPAAFDRAALYGDGSADYADNAWRFGLYCRAALEALRADARPIDVIHLHDWQAGPAAVFRDLRYADDPVIGRAAMVMTLHNLAYHGWVGNAALGQLGLLPRGAAPGQNPDGIDLLAAGIEGADLVNTVSPGYAAEALTPDFGMGLDGLLRSRGDRFIGILNGLDTTVWDPATDDLVAAPYYRADRSGKAICRADLLERNGLDPTDRGPVLGMIGRLDPQKGFDLLFAAAPALLARGWRLIVQGSGPASLADPFRALAAASTGKDSLVERFDRVMARRIYAGSDAFAMPSRFEPCGQGQMIALRYGTPPIVHRTGGLADTVVDATLSPSMGTGFVFDEPTAEALLAACDRAAEMRAAGEARWEAVLDRGMAVDFDWVTGSAPRYVDAYRRAMAIRGA